MIRAFLYLLLLAAVAFALAWFADRPGLLTLRWLGYEIETSVFVAVLVIFGLTALLLLIFGFIAYLLSGPRRMARFMREKRRARGLEALRRGIFAVGAGDEAAAAHFAGEARRALPNEPLTKLLRAQSAQLSGDRGTARRIFETLADSKDTELLGLRGLFIEATHEGHTTAARQFAERAIAINPALPWPVHALFELQCRAKDWQGALETLAAARTQKHFDRRTLERRRAVLLTAQAMEIQETQPAKALDLALEAHRLAPGLVPAANIAGRLLANQGASHKAARVIARSWQAQPHPDLAVAYAFARPGESPRDRLGRIRSLASLTPDHAEARVALATAACDAHEWEQARAALHPLLAKNPTARVCALMARIEGGEKRDAGRVREWLARAVRAPRDPVWMADGVVSEEWQPVSPVTGALDAFEWRTPADPAKGALADPLLEEVASLGRELDAVAHTVSELSIVAEPAHPGEATKSRSVIEQPPPAELSRGTAPVGGDIAAAAAGMWRPGGGIMRPAEQVDTAAAAIPANPALPSAMGSCVMRPDPSGDPEAARGSTAPAPQPSPSSEGRNLPVPAAASRPLTGPSKPASDKPLITPPPVTAPSAAQTRRSEPNIFVPDRAPDDPGPEPTESEETETPIGRYLSAMKQQAP
jgi:HemY protein